MPDGETKEVNRDHYPLTSEFTKEVINTSLKDLLSRRKGEDKCTYRGKKIDMSSRGIKRANPGDFLEAITHSTTEKIEEEYHHEEVNLDDPDITFSEEEEDKLMDNDENEENEDRILDCRRCAICDASP